MRAAAAADVAKALVHGVLEGNLIGERETMFAYETDLCRFLVALTDFNGAVVVHITVGLQAPERMPLTPSMQAHYASARGFIGHFQLDVTEEGIGYVELKTGYITEDFVAADFIRTCGLLEEDFLSEAQSALEAVT